MVTSAKYRTSLKILSKHGLLIQIKRLIHFLPIAYFSKPAFQTKNLESIYILAYHNIRVIYRGRI